MISREYKCIFVHQPKTGGTSIIKTFGLDWDNPDAFFMNSGVCEEDFLFKPDGYFTFSVVRNPYDRFVSGWKFCHYTRNRSLMDVLEKLPACPPNLSVVTDPDCEHYAGAHITALQSDRLLLPNNHFGVDAILRYEKLQEGFDAVCDRLGKPRQILPLVNTTRRGQYQHYFTREPAAKQLFDRHFQADLELFEYNY
jgi:hypothetical protein